MIITADEGAFEEPESGVQRRSQEPLGQNIDRLADWTCAIILVRALSIRPASAILEIYPNFRAFTARRWTMKVRSSVRRICEKCKLIKRKGVVRVICEDPRHKQRQG